MESESQQKIQTKIAYNKDMNLFYIRIWDSIPTIVFTKEELVDLDRKIIIALMSSDAESVEAQHKNHFKRTILCSMCEEPNE